MSPIDEPPAFRPKASEAIGRRQKSRPPASEPTPTGPMLSFTIDAATGRITKLEGVDEADARHELTSEEIGKLLAGADAASLENVVESAFEAGIDCVFGSDIADTGPESDEDVALRRLLLRSLMADGPAERLLHRDVLGRAITATLIRQAAGAKNSRAH